MADEQDPWAAILPCYSRDEPGQDAVQQPARKKQRRHWHSDDAARGSGTLECRDPAKPGLTSVGVSADLRDRSCSPPDPPRPHPSGVFGAAGSDGGGQTAWAVSSDPRCMGEAAGRLGDWRPDAPPGQPCAPEAGHPALQACAGARAARGESAGHWIDAALADEGRWWAEAGAEWSMWGGWLEDSDEALGALLVGAGAAAR